MSDLNGKEIKIPDDSTSQKNVRFWVYYKNDWVKLTLRGRLPIRFGFSIPDKEGGYVESYRYRIEECQLVKYWMSGGVDCDVEHFTTGTQICSLNDIEKVPVHDGETGDSFEGKIIFRPDWKNYDEVVHDGFAINANY